MNQREFSLAVALAQSDETLPTLLGENCSVRLVTLFDGFGLASFKPVTVTIRDVAALVRHEAMQMNGELSNEALTEIQNVGRHKFNIVGLGDTDVTAIVTELSN
jgi:hypothetical protein